MPKLKPKKPTVAPEVSAAAAALGKKGGANGTGEAKTRNPEHYRVRLVEARRAAALRRKLK